MTAPDERIRETVERYVALVGKGSADDVVALYADGATVEDPVGSPPRTTREQIHEFYATLEGLEQETRLLEARIAGGQAAFHFEVRTTAGDQVYVLSPIDVMTFDDEARITSMRAYWGESDMRVEPL